LWYLSGRSDLAFIEPYVPAYKNDAEDDGTIHGGYGPRLFTMRGHTDQIASVTKLLQERPSSRRAVIQLFNAEDIVSPHKEVPCTTTMQLFNRGGQLHMAVTLRSNDAYKGLPHDVFCFTMLQEMIATRLDIELGEYYQYVGSMHVYDANIADLSAYIDEGYQRLDAMPRMPAGDPFAHVPNLLDCERRMRAGEYFDATDVLKEPYWADLARLLQAFWASGIDERLDDLRSRFTSQIYRTYLESRRGKRRRHGESQ
jgi:thymidylate synthase